MQLLFETFFYISYCFDDTRIKQKNRFFRRGVSLPNRARKHIKKKNTSLLFLATLQHIQNSSKSERDTCVTSLVSKSTHGYKRRQPSRSAQKIRRQYGQHSRRTLEHNSDRRRTRWWIWGIVDAYPHNATETSLLSPRTDRNDDQRSR